MLDVQTTGYATKGHPEEIHADVAALEGLVIAPTIAKRANNYIQMLQQLDSQGKVDAVEVVRKTADGRSVIDRGLWPDKADVLLQGALSCCSAAFIRSGESAFTPKKEVTGETPKLTIMCTLSCFCLPACVLRRGLTQPRFDIQRRLQWFPHR